LTLHLFVHHVFCCPHAVTAVLYVGFTALKGPSSADVSLGHYSFTHRHIRSLTHSLFSDSLSSSFSSSSAFYLPSFFLFSSPVAGRCLVPASAADCSNYRVEFRPEDVVTSVAETTGWHSPDGVMTHSHPLYFHAVCAGTRQIFHLSVVRVFYVEQAALNCGKRYIDARTNNTLLIYHFTGRTKQLSWVIRHQSDNSRSW